MSGNELICFEMISYFGSAKSSYLEALQAAKNKDFDQAKVLIEEGDAAFLTGHHAHASLIQQEASGDKVPFSIFLVHAEDQLMSAELVKILCVELIEQLKK
jgi:PTS system cellobiose-specific IIA component